MNPIYLSKDIAENLTKNEDFVVLDDSLWEELYNLTNGAAGLCYQCGVCTATCPWGLFKEETFSVRSMMRQAQLGLDSSNENLWLCTTCGQCEFYCPRNVSITEVFRGLRQIAWDHREIPNGFPSLLWSVQRNNNPWDQPPSQRSKWARDLDLCEYNSSNNEILFYVGSTSSYNDRAQKIAYSLVRLFHDANVSFGVMANSEPTSGTTALDLGHILYFKEIAAENVEIFQEIGAATLVTTSPHSYDIFKNHYPHVSDDFHPLHYTQYLNQLIMDSRLHFRQPVELKVTFHDPCFLSRHNNECLAPRQILQAIPGLELIEMTNNQSKTLCCGGGGGRMWLETAASERFSDLRIHEAVDTGAQILATACPYCIIYLEDSMKDLGIGGLRIMDIAEIAVLALANE
jgi:Fe-S oxidoreductase